MILNPAGAGLAATIFRPRSFISSHMDAPGHLT